MPISVRERGIFVEIEAVAGTPETLVGADALQVQNLQVNMIEQVRMIEREIIRSSLNPEKSVYGGSLMSFQFDVELKGGGAADTPPIFGDLLRACSCEETIVAATSVTYNPISDLSAQETCTIGYREGGNYRIATGCVGTFSINMTTGEYARITFNMKGKLSSESTTAAPTPTFQSTVPPAFLGATFQYGGSAYPIESLTFDIANEISNAPNPNLSDGFQIGRIVGRQSGGTLNPEVQLISTEDFVGDLRTGATYALQSGVIGSAAGNRWAFNVTSAYTHEIAQAEREELLIFDIGYRCVDTDGTDDFQLQFT